MAYRVDVTSSISGIKRTPEGGLLVPANFTRSGVFLYRQPDGTIRRELRHPDDVFKADSMTSLRGATLCVGHPGVVRTDNWSSVAVGHICDDVHREGKFLSGSLRVLKADAVKSVESRMLKELSCGYTCDLDLTSGDFEGERFDARQTNIAYNHVALLPEGEGRAGRDVALRMDGSAYAVNMTLEEALKEIDRLKGELTGLQTRLDKAEKLDINALVEDRLHLVQDARDVLGAEYDLAGKKDIDVMREACTKAFPDMKLDSSSEDYLRGLFTAAVAQSKASRSAVASANVRVDSTSVEDKIAQARSRNEKRSRNAWKGEVR